MTPQDFNSRLKKLKECVLESVDRIEIVALNEMNANIKNRVFRDGLATNETLISSKVIAKNPRVGAYSKTQGRKRAKRNRRNDKVNLFLDGNLDASLSVGIDNGDNVIKFDDPELGKIARYQEKYRKQKIWSPSDNETELSIETVDEELSIVVRECLGR